MSASRIACEIFPFQSAPRLGAAENDSLDDGAAVAESVSIRSAAWGRGERGASQRDCGYCEVSIRSAAWGRGELPCSKFRPYRH